MGRVRGACALGLAALVALVATGCGAGARDVATARPGAGVGGVASAAVAALARGGAVRVEARDVGAVQVDQLEGAVARVVPLAGGPARTIRRPRRRLPSVPD